MGDRTGIGWTQATWNPWHGCIWVIVGGESGPGWRAMQLEWVSSIILQCDAAGVPVFVKQAAGMKPGQQGEIPDELFRHDMPPAFARFAR